MANNNNQGQSNNAHYSCIATATIKGRLAADPEIKYEQEKGRTKVTARVLVNKKDGSLDSWNLVEYKDDKAEYPSANFRALSDFLKKGRFVTVTGEIRQNNRKNEQTGQYSSFMEIKAYAGSIVMDSTGNSEGGQQGGQQGGNSFGSAQSQGNNFGGAQPQQQGNFGGAQQPQGNFGGQPQGNFGGQPQQQAQPQGNFGGQPQGNFGGQPQGNFGAPQGNFGGQPQGNFGAPQGQFGAPQGNFGQ